VEIVFCAKVARVIGKGHGKQPFALPTKLHTRGIVRADPCAALIPMVHVCWDGCAQGVAQWRLVEIEL
jgi:hypothetical protein